MTSYGLGVGSLMPMINEVSVSSVQYHEGRARHTISTTPGACRQIINGILVSSPIIFKQLGVILTPEEEFDEFKTNYLNEFIWDVGDEIATLGIVAWDYKIVTNPLNGRLLIVPYVLKDGLGRSYDITILKDVPQIGVVSYRFWRLINPNTGVACQKILDPSVRILGGFGYDPHPVDGSLRSIASSIAPHEVYYANMMNCSVALEIQKARGMIFLETKEDNSKNQNKKLDKYADADSQNRSADMIYKQTQAELRNAEMLKSQVVTDDINKQLQSFATPGFGTFGEIPQTPVVLVPVGRHVVQNALPSGLTDWEKVTETYRDNVCAAYDVPKNMIFQDGKSRSTVNEDSKLIANHFNDVIDKWKKRLEKVLNIVNKDLFSDGDFRHHYMEVLAKILHKDDMEPPWTESDDAIIKRQKEKNFSDPVKVVKSNRAEDKSTIYENGKLVKQGKSPQPSAYSSNQERTNSMAIYHLARALGFGQGVEPTGEFSPEFRELAEIILSKVKRRVEKKSVSVKYAHMPNATSSELLSFFCQGVINWDVYCQILAGMNNLPIGKNAPKKDDMDHDGGISRLPQSEKSIDGVSKGKKRKRGKEDGDSEDDGEEEESDGDEVDSIPKFKRNGRGQFVKRPTKNSPFGEDPWGQVEKLSIIRNMHQETIGELGLIGQVMFPPVKWQDQHPMNEDGKRPSSSSSSKKKQKKKESKSSSSSDKSAEKDAKTSDSSHKKDAKTHDKSKEKDSNSGSSGDKDSSSKESSKKD